MYSVVNSAVIRGMKGMVIQVEADVCDGLPSFEMVGVPASEVREAKERIRSAIRNMGYRLAPKKVTVNLCPADIPKKGTGFDLPMALAVLGAYGLLDQERLWGTLFVGEITLSGQLKEVRGILPMVLAAREAGIRRVVTPVENAPEAATVKDMDILPAESLRQVTGWLQKKETLCMPDIIIEESGPEEAEVDFAQIQGQQLLKKACEAAAAGRHNLLMSGPPGSGKTMAARAIPGILPEMNEQEKMELAQIYSVRGAFGQLKGGLSRPFRSPHYSVTRTALIGGGRIPQPGEISLAHNGVLFLDELTEFPKAVLEQLRQPLEEREVRLVRIHGTYNYPADFMLVAAMNPCSCGYYPDRNRCTCSPHSIRRHLQKVSRPFLDRMDLAVEAPRITREELSGRTGGESSGQIRQRVSRAHAIQQSRYRQEHFSYNSQIPAHLLQKYCNLTIQAARLLEASYDRYDMSLRSYHRLMRVARTVADLAQCETVGEEHVIEALLYRGLGDTLWRNLP